ncbi:hypothetical protein EON83_09840 [bacterium]|nr:MAG: hypothetical protein EON83_09840 [bacterium]
MEKYRTLRTGLWATIGAGLLAGYGLSAAVNQAIATPQAKSASKRKRITTKKPRAKSAATPKPFNGNVRVSPIPLTEGSNVIYTVNKDGELEWHKHIMKVGMVTVPGTKVRKRGIVHTMTPPRQIGIGWASGMRQVHPGGQKTIYGITDAGALRWFRHDGYQTGIFNWAQDTVVGKNWQSFRKVIGMDSGVLYGWSPNGELRWYKNINYTNGQGRDMDWAAHVVGKHWNFQDIFGGGNGVLYAVTEDGKLMWYRHRNYLNAVRVLEDVPQTWQLSWDGPKQVGTGWDQFINIFSPGNGEIYAIKPTGELMYYQHIGWRNGATIWGEHAVVAKGWADYATTFARIKTDDPMP